MIKKTLNPGEWLNDKVVNFIIGLMLQGEGTLREQNPDWESCFIFKSTFMSQLLNEGSPDNNGTYKYSNVIKYTYSQKNILIYLVTKKYLSPSTIKIFIGFWQ